jgi:hypothetical protein
MFLAFKFTFMDTGRRKLQQAIFSKQEVPIETSKSLQFTPAIEQTHMYLDLQGAYLCLHRPPHTSRPRTSASNLLPDAPSFRHLSLDGTITLPLSPDHLIPFDQYAYFICSTSYPTRMRYLYCSTDHASLHSSRNATAFASTNCSTTISCARHVDRPSPSQYYA